MNLFRRSKLLSYLSAAAICLCFSAKASAVDAAAAQTLARQSACFNCHAIDKKKVGPAWKDVAAQYKGRPDAEAHMIDHLTKGPDVKFEDGHHEKHPMVKSKNQDDIKNLADWILSL
jgi:cytochrome c